MSFEKNYFTIITFYSIRFYRLDIIGAHFSLYEMATHFSQYKILALDLTGL